MMKLPASFAALTLLSVCLFVFVVPTITAQSINIAHLTITDQMDGITNVIDTIVPVKSDMQKLLKKLGYDQQHIQNNTPIESERKVIIAVEELRAIKNTDQLLLPDDYAVNWDKLLENSGDGKVENLKDGKKMTLIQKDELGKPYKEELVVQVHRQGQVPFSNRPSTTPKTDVHPRKTLDKTFTFSGKSSMIGDLPSLQVTVGDLDMYDALTVHRSNIALLNARPLPIANFSIKPEFNEGFFRFIFDITQKGDTQLFIYNLAGHSIYQEKLAITAGTYSKTIPFFSLAVKGVYYVVITQAGQKFMKKVTFH